MFPQNTMTKCENYIRDTVPSKYYDKRSPFSQKFKIIFFVYFIALILNFKNYVMK